MFSNFLSLLSAPWNGSLTPGDNIAIGYVISGTLIFVIFVSFISVMGIATSCTVVRGIVVSSTEAIGIVVSGTLFIT